MVACFVVLGSLVLALKVIITVKVEGSTLASISTAMMLVCIDVVLRDYRLSLLFAVLSTVFVLLSILLSDVTVTHRCVTFWAIIAAITRLVFRAALIPIARGVPCILNLVVLELICHHIVLENLV